MLNNVNTNVERIIAKIDNDFNPDNSDWIPRVGAWTIDAMSQINVLRKIDKTMKLRVQDRIAYSPCTLDKDNLIIYDKNGCKLDEANRDNECGGCSSTGEVSQSMSLTADTVDIINNDKAVNAPDYMIAETVNAKAYPDRYNVHSYNYSKSQIKHNYVLIDCNKIELNYDTNCIVVKYKGVETQHSDVYGCDFPVIPNNGLLIEAIACYCMYKMLCRGYKHPVFNLAASQYGTNPYFMWKELKEEAKRGVIIDAQGDVIDDGGNWRNAFYNFTFNPRG